MGIAPIGFGLVSNLFHLEYPVLAVLAVNLPPFRGFFFFSFHTLLV